MSERLRLLRLWVFIGLVGCAALVYACLMRHPPQVGIHNFDKVEHFLAYLILGAWFAEVLPNRLLRVFVGLAVLGALIELIQHMTTYRSGSIFDWIADVAGIAAGIGVARLGAMRWLGYIDRHVITRRNTT